MRLRLIAPVLLVLVVTVGVFLFLRVDAERDADRDAENRADIAATEVRGGIEQATNLVESLRRRMLGRVGAGITTEQFADIGARWLSPVGLPAAAWVEQVPNAGRDALRATLVTGADPMTAPGVDLGGEAMLAKAIASPRTLFRVTATPLAQVGDGTTGLFLVQSAPRLSTGTLKPGFVVLFVPGSWLIAEVTEESNPRLQVRTGGTSYGRLGNAATVASAFSAAGRRFEVVVLKEPLGGVAAALPWLSLGAGLVLAALAGALATIAERRTRAQREADRVFTLSPDPIAVVGPDGYFRRVNPAFERLLGYTSQELLARPVLDFVHPDDQERSLAEGKVLTESGPTVGFENRYICKDGSLRWLEWTVTRAPEEAVYAAARDVTDRRRSESEEAALRRVATLAAESVEPNQLFGAVAEEVARVLDVPVVSVVRYEPDDTVTYVGLFSRDGPLAASVDRRSLEGSSVLQRVRATRDVARIDDYSSLEGELAEVARQNNVWSTVGAPIVVAGDIWGAMLVSSTDEPLPVGTETHLADFTELLATAIAGAESHEALAVLADEQAALRRVATLVAEAVPPEELFAAAVREVGGLLAVTSAAMGRYDPDGMFTTVAAWSDTDVAFPVGERWKPEGTNVTAIVFRTGRPARLDDFSEVSGPIGERARKLGYRAAVGCPITVEGRLWGVMTAASTREDPLPPDTEARLASFTELVATAIANAESQEAIARLAQEQAALRRVATLVAEGATSAELFPAVAEAVADVLDVSTVGIAHFQPDNTSILVASHNDPAFVVGSRWPHDAPCLNAMIAATGRPARIDYTNLPGPIAEAARASGRRFAVGAPIIVGGTVWGMMAIAKSDPSEPLPPDTETRLAAFTELVATAIANAESKSELAASRRRIVAASDQTRREIERDLHDGTQQRLVSLGLAVRAAEASLPADRPDLRKELDRVAMGLADAVEDLQELSRGIHPAILRKGGLGHALRTLASRSPIAVDVDVKTEARLAEPIEVAAYFVASEALANAAKHSHASRIDVLLAQHNGRLLLSVRDDGVGGADTGRGSGLVGLVDRVEALGGSISVSSRAGEGTQITAELPVDLSQDSNRE